MLVPDISARQVQIRYSFTGAQLLLFGAVVYPGGRPPTQPADIAVVLRGPVQPILVREKQKIAGIWMNADSEPLPLGAVLLRRRLVPADPPDLVDDRTAAIYELGLHNLQLSPGGGRASGKGAAVRGRTARPPAPRKASIRRTRTASKSPTACSIAR